MGKRQSGFFPVLQLFCNPLLQSEMKHLCTINMKHHSGSCAVDQCLVEMITDKLLGGWRHAPAMAKALHMLALYDHAYLFSVSVRMRRIGP